MIRKEASPLFVQIYISTGIAFEEMVVDERYVLYPNNTFGKELGKGKGEDKKGQMDRKEGDAIFYYFADMYLYTAHILLL